MLRGGNKCALEEKRAKSKDERATDAPQRRLNFEFPFLISLRGLCGLESCPPLCESRS